MAKTYLEIQKKIAWEEEKRKRAAEEKKAMELLKKELEAQEIIERQRSRGEILEKYLREPLVLTNEEIDSLLEMLFRSSIAQQQMDRLLATKKAPMTKAIEADAKTVEEKKSVTI